MRHESKVIPFAEPQSDVQISSKFPVEKKQGGGGGGGEKKNHHSGQGRRKGNGNGPSKASPLQNQEEGNKTGASAPEASAEVG